MHKPDPVEIVLIAVPVLCEIVALSLFLAAIALWAGIGSHAL
jgi:hypothetical protein